MATIKVKKRQQRIAYKGTQKYYVTSSVTYSKIPTEELIELASENSGIAKAQMSAAFYAIQQQIRQFLFNGHSIELSSLGCFYLGTNSHATTEEEKAGADSIYRIAVKFRQSKALRTLINSNVKLADIDLEEDDDNTSSSDSGDSGDSGNTSSDDKEVTI